MTATKGLGTYGDAAGVVTPLDHKMAQSGLITKTSTANLVRGGLFYNGTSTIVSGTANMSYDVAAFTAALTRGATAGTVLLTNDATYNVVTTAAPGSNSRYDVVYVWAREFSIDGSNSTPVIGVENGVAAASPTVPSLSAYPGAIELARILVPAGVTATNSGTTITQKAPFTAASGGVIPFRSTTERDEGTYNEGQLGWLIDSDALQRYDGSGWATLVPDAGTVKITGLTASGTGVTASNGLVTFSSSGSVNVNSAFSSTYRNYLIKYEITGASTTLTPRLQMRVSSTTATGASDYGYRQVLDGSTAHSGAVAFWRIAPDVGTSTTGGGDLQLFAPFVATQTRGHLSAFATASATTGSLLNLTGYHSQATSYDGFTLTASTGTFSGFVQVYGYN